MGAAPQLAPLTSPSHYGNRPSPLPTLHWRQGNRLWPNHPHSVALRAPPLPHFKWGRGRGPSLAASASSPPSSGGEVVCEANRSGGRIPYAIPLPQAGRGGGGVAAILLLPVSRGEGPAGDEGQILTF